MSDTKEEKQHVNKDENKISFDRPRATQFYRLRLFITGTTQRSVRALSNIKAICEEHLEGRYELEVIDIYQQPELAREDQIVAVPTLIKKLPAPLRKFIGDLSDTDKILVGLNLKTIRSKDHCPHEIQSE